MVAGKVAVELLVDDALNDFCDDRDEGYWAENGRIMTCSASKAEKVPNFTKPRFPKKGVGKFSKKLHL